MSKEAVVTMKLEPELRDAYLRAKVDTARAQIASGQVASSADVEARFDARRAAQRAKAGGADALGSCGPSPPSRTAPTSSTSSSRTTRAPPSRWMSFSGQRSAD